MIYYITTITTIILNDKTSLYLYSIVEIIFIIYPLSSLLSAK